MTNDELIEDFRHHAEVSRRPGWDSKVISDLLNYCAKKQRGNMKGREWATATDALILQIDLWLDAEARLAAIEKVLRP